ncbi:MAG TPA: SDR family oxidoreductase [Flavobacterium sp.]|jgi:hypothetical protein
MKENNNKHALITGATSGIGYELAKLFAADNYNLILVARNRENLEITAREMEALAKENHVHIIESDLFEPGAAEEIYAKTTALGVTVDVLVNNAGQGEWGKFSTTDLQREIDIVQLNIIAMMSLTKLYLKDMLARNEGKILQLASSASKAPSPYLSVYAATKAFVLSLSEALMKEIEDTNVTITVLRPGPTDTDFFHKAKGENSTVYKEMPMYTPEEVAKAGFKGLMDGDAVVMPGMMNKMQEAANLVMPDSMVAGTMKKQMEPSDKADGKTKIDHPASARERESINELNEDTNGDYA